jgi:phosphate acetyltransferase
VLASLRERAAARPRRIVLPETGDPRTQDARKTLDRAALAEVIWIEDPAADPRFERAVEHIFARRRAKGLDRDGAAELARRPLFFAASLVALNEADGCVAGAVHTTADVIRAGIYCVGMAPDIPVVSSMFLMVRGITNFSYADAGVVPEPDASQLAAIATATTRNHQLLTDEEPRVAFLSFSTKGSAEHERIDTVREGLALFREQHPEIEADGELQFDAAIAPEVAAVKAPGSTVAGRANVFVFPNLDAGNLAYKITQRLGNFLAFGPLIQGLARPCLDLSRGCTADDIVQVAVIASVMAE